MKGEGEVYPGGSEEEDIDADECDRCFLSGEIRRKDRSVCVLTRASCAENCHEKLADCHSDRWVPLVKAMGDKSLTTPEEKRTTSPFVNSIETG
jgi:hypothetical protein